MPDGLLRFSLSLGLWIKPAFIYMFCKARDKIRYIIKSIIIIDFIVVPIINTFIVLRIDYLKINYLSAL